MKRLLVIGLDGFDAEVAAAMERDGLLPNLARLRAGHRFHIQPGPEKFTGLVWEQFSSGLTPEQSSRWSANTIDPERYHPGQPATRLKPFTEHLTSARTVVFDVPYFDLLSTAEARGMVAWGSHDPGIATASRPESLADEIAARFGPYPAAKYLYGHVWHNPPEAATMAAAMIEAVERRSTTTQWLLKDRLPDWDLAITVISEYHSATEALWHGWETAHPLHSQPSAAPAREGLVGVYTAADRMLGAMLAQFPDARILVFNPHGMGRNLADVPAMLLLPELLYRHYTGRTGYYPEKDWQSDGTAGPSLDPNQDWSMAVNTRMHIEPPRRRWFQKAPPAPQPTELDWMPASRYRTAWPEMPAFAVPAYYDGRIRVNLKGREQQGVIAPRDYNKVIDEICKLIRSCKDPVTAAPIDVEFELRPGDPLQRDTSDADLFIRFNKDCYAFDCPGIGRIGPAPCRRPGGHTGGHGVGFYVADRAADPGAGSDWGTFPATELSGAILASMGSDRGENALARALKDFGSREH